MWPVNSLNFQHIVYVTIHVLSWHSTWRNASNTYPNWNFTRVITAPRITRHCTDASGLPTARLRALARNAGSLTRCALPSNALVISSGDNDWRCRDLQWLPRAHAINIVGRVTASRDGGGDGDDDGGAAPDDVPPDDLSAVSSLQRNLWRSRAPLEHNPHRHLDCSE